VRCIETEREACICFASSLLQNPQGLHASFLPQDTDGAAVDDNSNNIRNNKLLPGGVQDAWRALSSSTTEGDSNTEKVYSLGKGQLGKMTYTIALATALQRSTATPSDMDRRQIMEQTSRLLTQQRISSEHLLHLFYERVQDIKEYHAKHHDVYRIDETERNATIPIVDDAALDYEPTNKRKKRFHYHGNPEADGYDLVSLFLTDAETQSSMSLGTLLEGGMFSGEEVYGKYLDLTSIHTYTLTKLQQTPKLTYVDFLDTLLKKGLSPDPFNLKSRTKPYAHFLHLLIQYIEGYLKRTQPLLSIEEDIKKPCLEELNEQNVANGTENINSIDKPQPKIDLTPYNSVKELEEQISADELKLELSRLGLKCGGTAHQRAERLFATKHTPLDQLPQKFFSTMRQQQRQHTKGTTNDDEQANPVSNVSTGENNVAQLEAIATALLNQVRPILDATLRRAERRLTQTVQEREREIDEEIRGSHGTYLNTANLGGDDTNIGTDLQNEREKKGGFDNDESNEENSDDENQPIYNPKNVPLDWDGKPIPYWLFKLHGLNHYYSCEICGNESYRGRRDFEKHFCEMKHAHGMRCLGIPNTKHFHGITKIKDAQALWASLQENLYKDVFDSTKDEEYEDSHGNVLSRATYEDLARQGLL
jgi:splicing factor 3A subunit 3